MIRTVQLSTAISARWYDRSSLVAHRPVCLQQFPRRPQSWGKINRKHITPVSATTRVQQLARKRGESRARGRQRRVQRGEQKATVRDIRWFVNIMFLSLSLSLSPATALSLPVPPSPSCSSSPYLYRSLSLSIFSKSRSPKLRSLDFLSTFHTRNLLGWLRLGWLKIA